MVALNACHGLLAFPLQKGDSGDSRGRGRQDCPGQLYTLTREKQQESSRTTIKVERPCLSCETETGRFVSILVAILSKRRDMRQVGKENGVRGDARPITHVYYLFSLSF